MPKVFRKPTTKKGRRVRRVVSTINFLELAFA